MVKYEVLFTLGGDT